MKQLFLATLMIISATAAQASITMYDCQIIGIGGAGFGFDDCSNSQNKNGHDGIVGVTHPETFAVLAEMKRAGLRGHFTVTQTAYGVLTAINGKPVKK